MEDKRAEYSEDEIITLEFDEGDSFECGIMGVFDLDDKLDIPEEDFARVAAEFDRLMDEPVEE